MQSQEGRYERGVKVVKIKLSDAFPSVFGQ
jgi:hypothetical protein